jgi:formylglycine-generating enzyme required for sulfatase activity
MGKARAAAPSSQPWATEIDSSRANYLTDPATKPERGRGPPARPAECLRAYDMCGNVWGGPLIDTVRSTGLGEMRDPRGPASGLRVVRGGSWVNQDVSMLRNAYRHKVPPDTYAHSIGFRIVCAP